MAELNTLHVACLVTEGFEQAEVTEPVKALRDAGAVVDIISEQRGPVRGFKHHDPADSVQADKTFDEVQPENYDGLLLPGGAFNADQIRMIPQAQQFVRFFTSSQKPMAVICHAPWLLVSSGVAKGRTLTSWPTIQDDIKNAGASWVDQEVVIDGSLVTSRGPKDIPAFNREFIRMLGAARGAAQRVGGAQTTRA